MGHILRRRGIAGDGASVVRVPAGGGAVQEGGGGCWHGRLWRRGSVWEAAATRLGVGGSEAWRPWEAAAVGALAGRACMGRGAFSFSCRRREGERGSIF